MVTIDQQETEKKASAKQTSVPLNSLNKDSQKEGLNKKLNPGQNQWTNIKSKPLEAPGLPSLKRHPQTSKDKGASK